ncbi:glycosyl hydrolase [Georgenia halophila]
MAKLRFLTLWSINAELDQARLRAQVDAFADHGLDGLVWHPRFYPDLPPYLSEEYFRALDDVVQHAHERGIAVWIYDEDGWPSGSVGGRMLAEHPDESQHWLALVPTTDPVVTGEAVLTEFEHDGAHWSLRHRRTDGVDYLSPTLGRRFVEMTHEAYRTGLSADAFAHVEAFFSDEPEFGMAHLHSLFPEAGGLPWTPTLPAEYERRYGEPLLPALPAVLLDREDSARIRVQFWELLSDLLTERFLQPIRDWCDRHGKLFTAHLKGEEHPYFQVATVGSADRPFRAMSLPGIDSLGRPPGNHYFPRQVSSASRQWSSGRAMAETFGGSGWGSTPADLERHLRWLCSHGITDVVLHLSQLRLNSGALADWPPSHPLHLTWSDAYPVLLDRLRRTVAPRPPADTLLVSPHRAIAAAYRPREWPLTDVHAARTYPDSVAGALNDAFLDTVDDLAAARVAYDVADERTVSEYGAVVDGRLRVGAAQYTSVVLSPGAELDHAIRAAVAPLVVPAAGGAPTADQPVEQPAPRYASEPVMWRLTDMENDLLLDVSVHADGMCHAAILSHLDRATCVTLELADSVTALTIDGVDTAWKDEGDGARATLTLPAGENVSRLAFRPVTSAVAVYAWVCGGFAVQVDAPFEPDAVGMVATDGPFVLVDLAAGLSRPDATSPRDDGTLDLLAAGMPFLRRPVTLTTQVALDKPASAVVLDYLAADAVRLAVDGTDLGWHWPIDAAAGRVVVPAVIGPGTHEVRLTVAGSTYNALGPHHYLSGDADTISPTQIAGTSNFLDPHLPSHTHDRRWRFRRLSVPTALGLVPAGSA